MVTGAAVLLSACNQDSNSGGASDQGAQAYGHGAGGGTNSRKYAPDNTGRNQRDRSGDSLTSGDQGASDSDREITRQIRRAITSNDQLSTDAKNVKVITQNGKVTLRGPVKSAQEQQTIESLAKGVTGVNGLDDQLELKTNQ